MPQLSAIDVIAADMKATVAFYRSLGYTFDVWPSEDEPHHISISMDNGVDLMVNSVELARDYDDDPVDGRVIVIQGVETRDGVDELHASMTDAGHRSVKAPFDAFWGSRYAVLEDPAGVRVGVMSPMDQAFASAPSVGT